MLQKIKSMLRQLGYRPVASTGERLWIRDYDRESAMIYLVPERLPGQSRVSLQQAGDYLSGQEKAFMIKTGRPVKSLMLVLSGELPSTGMVQEIASMENAWIIDRADRRLMVFENQIEDFYGIRETIETGLVRWGEDESLRKKNDGMQFLAPVNLTMILINVAVFAVLTLLGNTLDSRFMLEHGAASWVPIVEKGEIWRLVTSGFVHFGIDHLFHNMIALLVIGSRLENLKGHRTYFIIYMGSEIVSALSSLFFTLSASRSSVSAGASGAVFGVIGALLCLALADVLAGEKGSGNKIGRVSFLFMLGFVLVGGVASPEVDTAAHAGGFIAGVVLMSLMMGIERVKRLFPD